MKTIGLENIPNQSFTVNLDSRRYDFVIKETRGVMSVSIARDNEQLVSNIRMVAGTPLLPYLYQEEGNFFLLTENQEYPDYNLFKTNQYLLYLTVAEVDAYLAAEEIEVGSFKPTLSFNFITVQKLISAQGFQPEFARASVASYYDRTGILVKAPIDTPRFDFDPSTLEAKGLLHEQSGTNLTLHSEGFDDAVWTKNHCSIAVNAAVAPDGSSTADKIIEDTTNNQHTTTQSQAFLTGQTYTFSQYFMAGERFCGWLFLPVAAFSGNPYCFVNLLTGTLGTPNGCTAQLQKLPGGRYRLSITATATASLTANYGSGVATGITLPDATYVGDGVGGIYIWGAQLENNPFRSSYIESVGTTGTRSAELVTLDTSGWLAEQLGTLFSNVEIPFAGLTSIQTGAELSDGTGDNILSHFVDGSDGNKRKQILKDATVTQFSYTSTAYPFNVPTKSAVAYQIDAVNGAIDGVLAATDTAATIPDFTQLTFGSDYAGNNNLNGWIREISYYSQPIRNPILRTLTE